MTIMETIIDSQRLYGFCIETLFVLSAASLIYIMYYLVKKEKMPVLLAISATLMAGCLLALLLTTIELLFYINNRAPLNYIRPSSFQKDVSDCLGDDTNTFCYILKKDFYRHSKTVKNNGGADTAPNTHDDSKVMFHIIGMTHTHDRDKNPIFFVKTINNNIYGIPMKTLLKINGTMAQETPDSKTKRGDGDIQRFFLESHT